MVKNNIYILFGVIETPINFQVLLEQKFSDKLFGGWIFIDTDKMANYLQTFFLIIIHQSVKLTGAIWLFLQTFYIYSGSFSQIFANHFAKYLAHVSEK